MSRSMPPMKGRIYVNRLTYKMSVIAGRIILSYLVRLILEYLNTVHSWRIFLYFDSFLRPSSLAMFNTTVFFALLLSCCLSLANASQVPLERIMSGVITQCTVNNTAALTFVRRSYLRLPLLFMRLTSFSPSIFRMMVLTSICTTCSSVISTMHWSCTLGRILLRLSKMLTPKGLSFSVRETLTSIQCQILCLNTFLFFSFPI